MPLLLCAVLSTFALAALAIQADSATPMITPIPLSQVAAYRPYTYFAATGYCGAKYTRTWSCGVNCEANPDFEPVAAGGDGEIVQYWFVGYSPSLKRVIVAHEGTQVQDIVSIASDVSIIQRPLDPVLFPGIPSSKDVRVHCGFADEQAKTATQILAAVNLTLAKYGTSTVTVVGHSLGGAIALLDAVYLQLHLSPSIKITVVTYGLPRVGNQGFADYVDDKFAGSVARVNNRKDIVPVIPPIQPLNYHHSSGELHVQPSGEWDSCPGQDNPSVSCSVGAVPSVFAGSVTDHDGPYDGVKISCAYLMGDL